MFLSFPEEEVVGTALVQSGLNKLFAEAAVGYSSILVDNCGDSEVVCARCLKKGSRTDVAVQAVKASVTEAKTARYQTGTRISSCANLSKLSTRKINCYILTLYMELHLKVLETFDLIFVNSYTGVGDF